MLNFTFFIFLFSFIVIGILVYLILWPSPLKPLIRLAMASPRYDLDETHVLSRSTNHVLYGKTTFKTVVVLLIGGGFLFNDFASHYGMSNALADSLILHQTNLLMLRYPVRFDNTVYDAMKSINDTMQTYALTYKQCHMIGFSAGALLAGMFIRKERSRALANLIKIPQIGVNVSSFVGICGLYDVAFDNPILTKLFGFYIMKGTPEYERYNCRELGIPTLVISSQHDILITQTQHFVETQPCTYKLFTDKLPHTFVQYVNLPQSLEALKLIVEFIGKNKDGNKFATTTTTTIDRQ